MKKLYKYVRFAGVAGISILYTLSCTGPTERKLVFPDHPEMKIGFSTQNFMNAFSFNVGNLTELIAYANEEGYQFIELRDDQAKLTGEECGVLAETARKAGIEIIYEINVNLLHPGFLQVFERGLANTQKFNPGILRTTAAYSEFADNNSKSGWTMEELTAAAVMAEKCATISGGKGVQFIVENIGEPFFGKVPEYYGLTDLFLHTKAVGLQFDLSNPFSSRSGKKADPDEVVKFLSTLGERWITTHVKTSVDGVAQPVLGENPLSIPEIIDLMGKSGVKYFALEIPTAETKEACFQNHVQGIKYLKDLGIIKKE